ncbi:hypothetical protein [Sporosarcina gallistercoris]|uniref:Lipoprotein n=1 Tax=Sporosarcina gallistercoris TaxID=2762245 RepID=A0ABR8PLQ4_9BACL|nr:hypothetical protein [Sporosarcina gallistercoris]MBD7909105.1 hypothetical protein [Sporosarcina gallistercoris]
MKILKILMYSLVLPVIILSGCSEKEQKSADIDEQKEENKESVGEDSYNDIDIGIIESAGDLIIDINDGNGDYKPFRMLNDTEIYLKVRDIIDNANWVAVKKTTSSSGEFRIESIDNEDKENPVKTFYYLSLNPDGKTVKLIDSTHDLYTDLNELDSEKLFGILVNENLSNYDINKNNH